MSSSNKKNRKSGYDKGAGKHLMKSDRKSTAVSDKATQKRTDVRPAEHEKTKRNTTVNVTEKAAITGIQSGKPMNRVQEEAVSRGVKNAGNLLSAEMLNTLRDRMVRVVYEHGQNIVTIDDIPDGVYLLSEGTAEVLDRDGAQINIMHEGQYFGEYGVLTNDRRLSTVRSLGKTVCYRIEPNDIYELFEKNPDLSGMILKRLYAQLSKKHEQVLELSRIQRGILQAPENRKPMSVKRIVVQYGLLLMIFVLSGLLIPRNTSAPLFILPLAMMSVYAIFTKRTLESLIVSGLYAAFLAFWTEPASAYSDAIMDTMSNMDNVFTVFVMALMGSMVALIEASGSVTAFKKWADRRVKGKKSALFASCGIMAATCIDDGLNMVCASQATLAVSDKKKVPHEYLGYIFSFMPTVLSSILPISLWGIFVIGTVNVSYSDGAVGLFCKSIPFNFYSIIVVITSIMFCYGILPKNKNLKEAEKRVKTGGKLWPDGSDKYLVNDEPEMWGKLRNIMLPILVLGLSSLLMRSISGDFMVDSAVGLFVTIVFMFFLYSVQKLMSPDRFIECVVKGMQDVAMPIVIYLLTTCFSNILEQLNMGYYFDELIQLIGKGAWILPAGLFLASVFFTVVLGSSWSMYAIVFPIAIRMGMSAGVGLPLCIGAVAAAGIAGEKNCVLTGDAASVAGAIGCNPKNILKTRLQYSYIFTAVATAGYIIAGIISM